MIPNPKVARSNRAGDTLNNFLIYRKFSKQFNQPGNASNLVVNLWLIEKPTRLSHNLSSGRLQGETTTCGELDRTYGNSKLRFHPAPRLSPETRRRTFRSRTSYTFQRPMIGEYSRTSALFLREPVRDGDGTSSSRTRA